MSMGRVTGKGRTGFGLYLGEGGGEGSVCSREKVKGAVVGNSGGCL